MISPSVHEDMDGYVRKRRETTGGCAKDEGLCCLQHKIDGRGSTSLQSVSLYART